MSIYRWTWQGSLQHHQRDTKAREDRVLMREKIIVTMQVGSLVLIWLLVVVIGIWVVNLLSLSYELHDVPSATFGISIVTVPVFLTIASVLTYVFIGLQKGKKRK